MSLGSYLVTVVVDIFAGISLDPTFVVVFSWCSDAWRSSHVSRSSALIWLASLTF